MQMDKCDFCGSRTPTQWKPDVGRWLCDACDAKYYCVECGKNIRPEDVFSEVEFGLYLASVCRSCAAKKGQQHSSE
jgi:hypothetical protein